MLNVFLEKCCDSLMINELPCWIDCSWITSHPCVWFSLKGKKKGRKKKKRIIIPLSHRLWPTKGARRWLYPHRSACIFSFSHYFSADISGRQPLGSERANSTRGWDSIFVFIRCRSVGLFDRRQRKLHTHTHRQSREVKSRQVKTRTLILSDGLFIQALERNCWGTVRKHHFSLIPLSPFIPSLARTAIAAHSSPPSPYESGGVKVCLPTGTDKSRAVHL